MLISRASRKSRPQRNICGLQVTHETHIAVDVHMQGMLDEAYALVKAVLERNRTALDELIAGLIEAPDQQLDGTEVRAILDKSGNAEDLQYRKESQAVFA